MAEQEKVSQEVYEQQREQGLTDELLALARSRIGVPLRVHAPFNEDATLDAIRHFAHGIGDDNPLFCDPEYAQRTRWGTVIAPPMFYRSAGIEEKHTWTEEEREKARDPLSGIHSWYSGDTIHWLRPVRPGDKLFVRRYRKDFIEKRSSFAGRMVIEVQRSEYRNQRGELALVSDLQSIRGGRQKKWGERQKYAEYVRSTYTEEDVSRIGEAYAKEARRGAEPRYWEDVAVGEELPPRVKGPLTMTDVLSWLMGLGFAMQYFGANRLAYQWRKAHPKAYLPNSFGAPEMVEAVHWDDHFARRTGNPYSYDYGPQRVAWLAHTITDWMGDEGWLRTLDCQVRRFVYLGDTVWIQGRVMDKHVTNGEHLVDIEVDAVDQRGEKTAPGRATVMLPSRTGGPVLLPPKLDLR